MTDRTARKVVDALAFASIHALQVEATASTEQQALAARKVIHKLDLAVTALLEEAQFAKQREDAWDGSRSYRPLSAIGS